MQVYVSCGPVCPAARAIGRTVGSWVTLTEPASPPSIPRQLVFAVRMCVKQGKARAPTSLVCSLVTMALKGNRVGPDRRLKFQRRGEGGALVLALVQAVLRGYAKHGGCVSAQYGCRQKMQLPCTRVRPLFEKENCKKDGTGF